MGEFQEIPIWVVYRSALIPCDIFSYGTNGYDLLLVEDQPIPKLQIKRMMKRGLSKLYIRREHNKIFNGYLERFLADRSAAEWLEHLISTEQYEQINFPDDMQMPGEIQEIVLRAEMLAAERKQKEKIEVKPDEFGKSVVFETKSVFLRSVRQFKQELLLVKDGGAVAISSPDDLRRHLKVLKDQLREVPNSAALLERMDAVDEVFEEMSPGDNWRSGLAEIVDEMSVLELTLNDEYSLVDTGINKESSELNELYSYKNQLIKENEELKTQLENKKIDNIALAQSNQKMEIELKAFAIKFSKLQSDHDRLTRRGGVPNLEVGKKLTVLENKIKGMREESVKQQREIGRLVSTNQELDRKLKFKEGKIKQLYQRIEELMNRGRRRAG